MKFRLGFVAMTLNLADCSPSRTVTVTAFSKLSDRESQLYRLRKIAKQNLVDTLRILRYNKASNISVYRLTSKLIPLATHPLSEGWDYVSDLKEEFKAVGDFIKENDFRVSTHPDHFTLINSSSKDVLEASIRDLDYHIKVFEAMGLHDYKYKIVLHVGGLYKDKGASIERFKERFIELPERIRKRVTLENDDKSYTALDVLKICTELNIPMVIDIHHHNCVNNGERLEELLPCVFDTWKGECFNPKIHFSSPKSEKDFRSHADFINAEDFKAFIKIARTTEKDFDVMLEAKAKDMALLQLSEELGREKFLYRKNEGEFELI